MTDDFMIGYIEKAKKRPKVGLSDAGHIILECSNCLCPLCDVWITLKEVPVVSEIYAICPYCNDKSFPKTVNGSFHLGATDYSVIDTIQEDTHGQFVVQCAIGEKKWQMK